MNEEQDDKWTSRSLGEICRGGGGSVQTGPFGSQLHAEDYVDDGIPIITVEHLSDGAIVHDNLPLVGESDYRRLSRYRLKCGDLVFSRVGAIDRCAFVSDSEDGWLFSGRCLRVRVGNGQTDPRYLAYVLNSWPSRQWILNHAVGSTMACLNTSILSSVPLTLAPPDEQSKIAQILLTVDRAIEQTEALIAKQQRIRTGLMQDLLTRGIDEHGNLRSEQTHGFKDSPLGRIPAGWELASLGSVAESVTSGSRGWAKYYREYGALFLRIGNLTREHINLRLDDLVFVQPPESAEGLRTAVQAGDLLISVTADLGIIGVIPRRFPKAYVNQHIALVRIRPEEVSTRFVGWFLSSRRGLAQFDTLNESGAKAGLNLPTVRSLLFPRPDVDEQHRIAGVIDACVRTVVQHAASLRKLRSLKRGLMEDLLTGNRRVTALLQQSEKSPA